MNKIMNKAEIKFFALNSVRLEASWEKRFLCVLMAFTMGLFFIEKATACVGQAQLDRDRAAVQAADKAVVSAFITLVSVTGLAGVAVYAAARTVKTALMAAALFTIVGAAGAYMSYEAAMDSRKIAQDQLKADLKDLCCGVH
jgi:hypothetical protein